MLLKRALMGSAFTFAFFLLTFGWCLNVRRAESRLSGKTILRAPSVPNDVSWLISVAGPMKSIVCPGGALTRTRLMSYQRTMTLTPNLISEKNRNLELHQGQRK